MDLHSYIQYIRCSSVTQQGTHVMTPSFLIILSLFCSQRYYMHCTFLNSNFLYLQIFVFFIRFFALCSRRCCLTLRVYHIISCSRVLYSSLFHLLPETAKLTTKYQYVLINVFLYYFFTCLIVFRSQNLMLQSVCQTRCTWYSTD